MDRNLVIESAYEAVKDGLDWGIGDKEYGDFVNGIVAMTDILLEKLEANPETEIVTNGLNENIMLLNRDSEEEEEEREIAYTEEELKAMQTEDIW